MNVNPFSGCRQSHWHLSCILKTKDKEIEYRWTHRNVSPLSLNSSKNLPFASGMNTHRNEKCLAYSYLLVNYLTEATSLLPVSILQDFSSYKTRTFLYLLNFCLLNSKDYSREKPWQYWKIQDRGKVLGKAGLFTLIVWSIIKQIKIMRQKRPM